jgi:hypothetical protein
MPHDPPIPTPHQRPIPFFVLPEEPELILATSPNLLDFSKGNEFVEFDLVGNFKVVEFDLELGRD